MSSRKRTVLLLSLVVLVIALGALIFWAVRAAGPGGQDQHPEEAEVTAPDGSGHPEEEWDEDRRNSATPLPMPVETK